jgi:hypothetical protein
MGEPCLCGALDCLACYPGGEEERRITHTDREVRHLLFLELMHFEEDTIERGITIEVAVNETIYRLCTANMTIDEAVDTIEDDDLETMEVPDE